MLRNEVTMAEEGTGDDQEFLIPSIGVSELENILEQHELWVESLGRRGAELICRVRNWLGPICREQI